MNTSLRLLGAISLGMLAACSGNYDDDELQVSEPTAPFYLSADKEEIESDGADFVTFTITDSNGLDLTQPEYIKNTSFNVEETGEWLSGIVLESPNRYSSIEDGVYTISAMYEGKPCAEKVKVTSKNRSKYEKFHKNVAIYRLTGAWCQYCPYMTEALSKVNDYTIDHSVIMEFHNRDEFSIAYNSVMDMAALLSQRYNTGDSYPYCIYSLDMASGNKTVNDIQGFVKEQLFKFPAQTGISAESELAGDELKVKITIEASVAGEYDLGIAVLKDNCIPTSDAYEEVYNDVVVGVSGNFYAMSVDKFNLGAGETKSMERSWQSNILSTDAASDCRVVLFTLREVDGKAIIDNVVDFKVGEDVDFRYN